MVNSGPNDLMYCDYCYTTCVIVMSSIETVNNLSIDYFIDELASSE